MELGKPFLLHRNQDISGVSGVGDVAWGCLFPDGTVVLRWDASRGTPACTSMWDTLEQMLRVHGHDGATVVQFEEDLDIKPAADAA